MLIGSSERRTRARRAWRGLTALFAVAAAAVLVAACGTGTSQDNGGGGGGNGKTVMSLKAITDNKPAWQQAIADYKKAAPDVTINASYAPVDDLQTSLRAQLGGGNAPDMFVVWPGNGSAMAVQQLAPTGLLADISDQKWIGQVPEGLRPLLGDKGKTYIWSPGVTPIGAIYNKTVFKQAGIDKEPTTWNELLADAQKIKAAGKVPIALGNQTPWITQLISYAIAPSTAFTTDPNLAQDMLAHKKSFENSDWDEVFKRYMELDQKGFFNKDPNGTTFEQQTNLVASGKAGMAIQVTGVLPTYEQAAKDPSVLGTFPFPANDQAGALKIPAGVSAGLAISANSKHADEAKKFVAFLGQPENMAKFAKSQYSVPLIPPAGYTPDPLVKPFTSYIKDNKSVPFMDQQWPNAQVQPAHFAGIQDLFAGKTDISGLLQKLDKAYNQK
jgi:raffinose/stachyose/melibiose transport system substrate-binding protein